MDSLEKAIYLRQQMVDLEQYVKDFTEADYAKPAHLAAIQQQARTIMEFALKEKYDTPDKQASNVLIMVMLRQALNHQLDANKARLFVKEFIRPFRLRIEDAIAQMLDVESDKEVPDDEVPKDPFNPMLN
ncbi:MAG TPA: hypothetical protein PKD90_12805 [Phnomibacter sp.]|nr:hypothetical protein [Phnomibacter sp.]